MHGRVAAVFGISGVGKTTMISSFTREHPWAHAVKGSSLLLAATSQADSEKLRAVPADEVSANQERLVAAFADLRAAHPDRHIIFDGHSIIDTDQTLMVIPADVIVRLEPSAIIFLEEAPSVISARRAADSARARPARSPEQLSRHQSLAKEMAQAYAKALSLPCHVIGTAEVQAFEQILLTTFSDC